MPGLARGSARLDNDRDAKYLPRWVCRAPLFALAACQNDAPAQMTDLAAFPGWLERYAAAWRSNNPRQIGRLFAADAVYRWHPWDTEESAAIGRRRIVDAWLEKQDPPPRVAVSAEAVATQGDLGIARCITSYLGEDRRPRAVFHNVFFVQLNGRDRCYDFVKDYMEAPMGGRSP